MNLREGSLYAQVAFSAAAGQGFEAGGHGVLKGGSAGCRITRSTASISSCRSASATVTGSWASAARSPCALAKSSTVTARNLTADLQGTAVERGQSAAAQRRQRRSVRRETDVAAAAYAAARPALIRLQHISSSELTSAVKVKQFAMSGAVSGALPLWLENNQWIIHDGWLRNDGPMTLRLDKDTADALVADNVSAGAAINWLRYMEISRSWTQINLDNLGVLTLKASINGTSRVEGKSSTVHLNYAHEENIFDLWRSLRFGDNLQAWLEQNATLPVRRCTDGKTCKEPK